MIMFTVWLKLQTAVIHISYSWVRIRLHTKLRLSGGVTKRVYVQYDKKLDFGFPF
jgi:hypothetical protein